MTGSTPRSAAGDGVAGSRRRADTPRKGRWSHKDLRLLEECYGTRDDGSLARVLGRPVSSVRERARAIFVAKPCRQGKPWTLDDDRRLKQCLGVVPSSVLAMILKRGEAEIEAHLTELFTAVRGGPWTNDEIRMLKAMFGRREDRVLSVVLSHTIDEVRETARRLRLAKDKAFLSRLAERQERQARSVRGGNGQDLDDCNPVKSVTPAPHRTRMKRWTEDEVALLRRRYPHEFNVKLAEQLDKSAKSIMSKAHALGLKKTPELLALMGKVNVRMRYDGTDGKDGQAK
jgi:hypothetical protein